MITDVKFFTKVSEIEEITGITEDGLWKNGFNLDDMDWGFCCSELLVNIDEDEFGNRLYTIPITSPQWARQLLDMMDDYCVGFSVAEYNGLYFYTQHHA